MLELPGRNSKVQGQASPTLEVCYDKWPHKYMLSEILCASQSVSYTVLTTYCTESGERQAVVRPMNKSSKVRLQSSDGEVLLLIKA